ncbi:MAG TPA: YdcF family protein, partial [Leptolinea sp.]
NVDWMESIENSPASDMRQIILKLGVPDSAIVLQPKSQNTFEDALYSAELLKEKGIKKIILVTSAMHMPRAVTLFEKQGLEVLPSPTDFTITEDGWNRTFSPNLETFIINILPNSSAMGLTTNVLKEYIGLVTYQVQGYFQSDFRSK